MAILSYAKSLSEFAKAGARIAKDRGIDCGKMCETCACKWEQDRDLTFFIAADNAADRLLHGGEFNCHTHDFKCADKPCAGFLMAKLALESSLQQDIERENAAVAALNQPPSNQ